jgi:hypothetical protein
MLEARVSGELPPLPSLAQEVVGRVEGAIEDVKEKIAGAEPTPSDAQAGSTIGAEFLPESPRE